MATSPSYSSYTPSGTPSPTASSTSSQAPKKRTRASKPKVRTGCITCKIRRVKCGEEKPACLRCTSTGRTCDGYDPEHSPSRTRVVLDPIEGAELAKSEFLKACQRSEALRFMRPLAPDIDGWKTSRRFIHQFRPIPADPELCSFANFWNRVAPQVIGDRASQQPHDPAVRYAIVALGAAYQLYRFPNEPLPEDFTLDSLEIFVIQQYNQSIARLQPHVCSSHPDSIRVTLICCLGFIFLETLRGAHAAAITHLMNGLQILQSLPPSTFDFFLSGNSLPQLPTSNDTFAMADIIRIFGRLEVSACFFPNAIRPVVALHSYRTRLFDTSIPPSSTTNPLLDLLTSFHRDVTAYLHETNHPSAPSHLHNRQHSALLARASHISSILPPPSNNPITTASAFAQTLALLNFHTALLLLSPSTTQTATHTTALHLSSLLHASPLSQPSTHCLGAAPSPAPTVSNPLAAPLYLIAFQSFLSATEIHSRAVRLLSKILGASKSTHPEAETESTLTAKISRAIKDAYARGNTVPWDMEATTGEVQVPRSLTGLGWRARGIAR
ncbi:transcriptional regulatory protein moc3 [Podospora aff. communis PSN243]|uniref:Transcriptional regulatory protein moc3 n=1 Tax=Podospora aff. communis PSN243 TaxID=3040156 RepID=A0AAV9H189_9PEZI|nr:transcriptional regulatory protein moc3 [Podospora aff. communis PSN243]